jgi:hypothetical protein
MNPHDSGITSANRALYRPWADPDIQGITQRAPRRVRGTGAWLAAAPMLAALGLTVSAALVVGATAKATTDLGRTRAQPVVAGAEQMRRHAGAVQAFRAQQYAQAYGRYAELADAGDAPAALMALAMLRQGPELFGSEWSITPGQLERWSAMALSDVREYGSAIALHDRGE